MPIQKKIINKWDSTFSQNENIDVVAKKSDLNLRVLITPLGLHPEDQSKITPHFSNLSTTSLVIHKENVTNNSSSSPVNIKLTEEEDYNGWIFVDKPKGMSSTQLVSIIKKQFKSYKVGHGGTLDPLAEGVLPIALGEATKTVNYVLNADKIYIFTIQFGQCTTTKDSEGAIIKSDDYMPSAAELKAALTHFLGEIQQIPPVFSAIKINGERAYNLARQGVEISMESRRVFISNLKLIDYNEGLKQATLYAKVSKGTYIRSLGEDIAAKIGALGFIIYLRRQEICLGKEIVLIEPNKLYNLEHHIKNYLFKVEDMLDDILAYFLTFKQAIDILNGDVRSLNPELLKEGIFKAVYKGKVIALLKYTEEKIKFLRVFNNQRYILINQEKSDVTN
ncbi:tRNA pseudouridine synthase B [Candidatus Hepatincolaceae symbiont of Richtersius coronifer]